MTFKQKTLLLSDVAEKGQSYILVLGLGDELAFAVDAGVGALACDLLLLLRDAAWGRGRPTRVQGTWDGDRNGTQ